MIERFTYFERAAHWINAIAFVVLAVSGLVMAFGKFLLLPLIGGTLFGWLTYALKNAAQLRRSAVRGVAGDRVLHLPAQQLPAQGDLTLAGSRAAACSAARSRLAPLQCRREAGVLGRRVLPRRHRRRLRPGARQGAARPWPTCAATCRSRTWCTRSRRVLMMAMFLGHIYLGTIGMKGAYHAMETAMSTRAGRASTTGSGTRTSSDGKIPAQRSAPAAGSRPSADRAGPASTLLSHEAQCASPVPEPHRSSPCRRCCARRRRRAGQAAAARARRPRPRPPRPPPRRMVRQGRRLQALQVAMDRVADSLPQEPPGRRQGRLGADGRDPAVHRPGPCVVAGAAAAAQAAGAHSPARRSRPARRSGSFAAAKFSLASLPQAAEPARRSSSPARAGACADLRPRPALRKSGAWPAACASTRRASARS